MPVLKYEQTTKKIAKLIEEGYGQGEGIAYKPFLDVIRVSSKGRISRIKGLSGRVHHFLSDSETRLFYIYEFAGKEDIREHYPLLEGMEEIIPNLDEELLKRLVNQKTGEPLILTTTFLITEKDENGELSYFARSVKDYRQLENKQVIERFEIMKKYWEARGVEYGIITNKEIPLMVAKNIEFIHPYFHLEEYGIKDKMQGFLKNRLVDMIGNSETKQINEILSMFDNEFNIDQGTGIAIYKHLLARKILSVNMNEAISFNQPCNSVQILTRTEVDNNGSNYKYANPI
ncbi:TnsA endonuclease C-terminal domain-containing protein [Bacillus sp. BRMEA1]|uniref:TnsA endonuclease C-terminal domain-containing protein n=1 Tax=Neobacillus endophyticus TaxID=2738405 RepID=UPI001566EB61|nr:TnsA endonuclease C-terminal domain-containing protein [Neobacillus endophyticus]NRD76571.1 TnsA endonuclease C-terminal domain-containing protein [Neobacillus endophyticus]